MNAETPHSPSQVPTLPWFALAATLLLTFLAGCRSVHMTLANQTEIAASVGDYQITALLDRPATLESKDDQAVLSFDRHRLRIEKGQVVLDDNETAAFPVTAKQIVIDISRRTLRVTADGEEIWKKPMPSE